MSLSLSMTNVGRALAYFPKLSRFLGSVNASIFFTQLHYWQSRTEDERGVYKSSQEWTDETGLSYREQATARQMLTKAGFLKETHKRLQHRIYFRLNLEAVDCAFDAWTKAESAGATKAHFPNDENAFGEMRKAQLADDGKRISPDAENAVGETTKAQFVNTTEITAKTTAESTAENSSPPPRKRGRADAAEAADPSIATNAEVDKEAKTKAFQQACRSTWAEYEQAYQRRYGTSPVRNGKVNKAVANIVKRLGADESPATAGWFVANVNETFIVKRCHAIGDLLAQCEAFRTQWFNGRAVTSTEAQQADKTAANFGAAGRAGEKALAILAQRRREQEGGQC